MENLRLSPKSSVVGELDQKDESPARRTRLQKKQNKDPKETYQTKESHQNFQSEKQKAGKEVTPISIESQQKSITEKENRDKEKIAKLIKSQQEPQTKSQACGPSQDFGGVTSQACGSSQPMDYSPTTPKMRSQACGSSQPMEYSPYKRNLETRSQAVGPSQDFSQRHKESPEREHLPESCKKHKRCSEFEANKQQVKRVSPSLSTKCTSQRKQAQGAGVSIHQTGRHSEELTMVFLNKTIFKQNIDVSYI